MKFITTVIIISLFLLGCNQKELSPEEIQKINDLKSELSTNEKELSKAKQDHQNYSDGLIKSLITARIEILQVNEALLKQRINALESGEKINIILKAYEPNLDTAKNIESEIETLNNEIKEKKEDASQYNGGIILSTKLATIATQEQTLAILKQRYLSAKYGLAFVSNDSNLSAIRNESQTENKVLSTEDQKPSVNKTLLPPENGPLGLKMGLTKKNIEDMTGDNMVPAEGNPNLYLIKSTPKKNISFDLFGLVISPTVGLCEIRAIGKTIKTNSYGQSIISEFKALRESLDSIYGESELTDKLLTGSILKEPQYWMMALEKKERFLFANWEKVNNDSMTKSDLLSVYLEARATNTSSGYLFLQYSFNNSNECEQEIENSKKSSL